MQPPPFMKGPRPPGRIPQIRNVDIMRNRDDREKTPEEDTTTTIGNIKELKTREPFEIGFYFSKDAAKRRQLPAWIREGLEKMEREKQKVVERERQEILRQQELIARKEAEDEARAVLNPAKSKFV